MSYDDVQNECTSILASSPPTATDVTDNHSSTLASAAASLGVAVGDEAHHGEIQQLENTLDALCQAEMERTYEQLDG
jgi:hypothetical protein